jgi:hypothetical protein
MRPGATEARGEGRPIDAPPLPPGGGSGVASGSLRESSRHRSCTACAPAQAQEPWYLAKWQRLLTEATARGWARLHAGAPREADLVQPIKETARHQEPGHDVQTQVG